MQELLTLEQVADLLGLHVRTVRGYVRDGRLRAVRIGKQYRVARDDLDAFTGRPAVPAPPVGGVAPGRVEVSSVVHADGITPALAERLRAAVLAAVGSREGGDGLARVEFVHDAPRTRLTVIVVGGPRATAEVLRTLDVLMEGAG